MVNDVAVFQPNVLTHTMRYRVGDAVCVPLWTDVESGVQWRFSGGDRLCFSGRIVFDDHQPVLIGTCSSVGFYSLSLWTERSDAVLAKLVVDIYHDLCPTTEEDFVRRAKQDDHFRTYMMDLFNVKKRKG